MSGIALCLKDNNCVNKDTCKRYIENVGEIMNMPSICNVENNYQWYWKVEQSIQTTQDKSDTTETDNLNN
jgi:hypothetical protein